MTTAVKEHPILFSGEMVRQILAGRGTRKKLYARKGESRNSPQHLARRLANGLDSCVDGECWVWMRHRNNHGYGKLTINGRGVFSHRLSYELSIGPIPDDKIVLHRCDNPACINPSHLKLGSQSDNMKDCYRKGRSSVRPHSCPGETNPAAKLTSEQVAEIRFLLREGKSQDAIASEFGVSQSQISNINLGKQWTQKQ